MAARRLAQRLGFRFLDTGASTRCVAEGDRLAGWRCTGPDRRGEQIELTDDQVFLDGEEVTKEIRSFEVTTLTRHAADNLQVRSG